MSATSSNQTTPRSDKKNPPHTTASIQEKELVIDGEILSRHVQDEKKGDFRRNISERISMEAPASISSVPSNLDDHHVQRGTNVIALTEHSNLRGPIRDETKGGNEC